MSETNVASTVEFLKWLFGENPNGFIYLYAERTKQDGTDERKFFTYTDPEEVADEWWDEWSDKFRLTYCTQTLIRRSYNKTDKDKNLNSGGNVKELPALWFDIDGCKKITKDGAPVVSGREFFSELKLQMPEVSAWVRSSEHGIHGFFRLDEPVELLGDKTKFEERVQPILLDIAWHLGADVDVATIGRLMRLPGSVNLKKEYKDKPFVATHHINKEAPGHSLKSLREKFAPDFDAVPRLVLYAIFKLMQEIWEEGDSRHSMILALSGSVRKAGLDRASCESLVKELGPLLVDDPNDKEDRLKAVETTYSKSLDSAIGTLHTDHGEIAEAVDSALVFWMALKQKYAKKRGIEWHPEVDPTQRKDEDKAFYVHEGQTWFKNDKGVAQVLANFAIRVLKKIVKPDDGSVVWLVEVIKPGVPSVVAEITADRQISFAKFVTIKPMLSGLVFEPPGLWGQYTKYLDEVYSDAPIVRETTYYGFLRLEDPEKPPMLLLPGDTNNEFLWPETRAKFDTALPGALRKEIPNKEAASYLESFAEFYPRYHDPNYLYSALGWMCGATLTAFLRHDYRVEGYPSMHISGLRGCGKSTLMTQVLGPHFGCSEAKSFAQGTTSPFAIRKRLSTNNVCPYILDEFKDEHELRTVGLQGIIRTLWNGYLVETGTAEGDVRMDHLVAPLCVIGEHTMGDEATLDRIFSVRVSPSWVKHVRGYTKEEKASFTEAQTWLHKNSHTGWLGTLLLRYLEQNIDEVPKIIDAALSLVEETCEIPNERKRKGFAAVFAGLILLSKVYQSYGVPFFLKKPLMLASVYGADPEIEQQKTPESSTLKSLFTTTDKIIIDGIRRHTSHEMFLYIFDPSDSDVAYFQKTRWFEEVRQISKASSSAALRSERGFFDLLREDASENDPIVLDMDCGHPFTGTIKVNVLKIAERFHVDVERWRRIADSFGET